MKMSTVNPPRPTRGGRRPKPPPEMPAVGKTWLAYRIQGAKSEKLDRLIHAHSREEAEVKARAAFGATTPAEKAKVYVREA
jgi:hypothetical protein